MNRNPLWVALALSAAAGYLGFTHSWGVGALVLLPFALRLVNYKTHAFLVGLVFSGVSLRGILAVEAIPDTPFGIAVLAWLLPTVLAAIPYAVVPCSRNFGYVGATLISVLPPFAFSATASPLILAGYVFPASGFFGMGVFLVLSQMIISVSRLRSSLFTTGLLGVLATGQCLYFEAPVSRQYIGIQTRGGDVSSRDVEGEYEMQESLYADLVALRGEKRIAVFPEAVAGNVSSRDVEGEYEMQESLYADLVALRGEKRIAVFPEAVAGNITSTAERRLTQIAIDSGQAYLSGAVLRTEQGLVNAVLKMNESGVEMVYRQQLPAPYFMWTGGDGGYRAFLLDRGTEVGDTAFLLCYEIALPLLVLKNHLYPTKEVLFLSNIWWAAGTSIQATMRVHAAGWSRLFGVPYTAAFNLPPVSG